MWRLGHPRQPGSTAIPGSRHCHFFARDKQACTAQGNTGSEIVLIYLMEPCSMSQRSGWEELILHLILAKRPRRYEGKQSKTGLKQLSVALWFDKYSSCTLHARNQASFGLWLKKDKKSDTFSICACHPCAGAMLIFSVSFQFLRMTPEGVPTNTINTPLFIVHFAHASHMCHLFRTLWVLSCALYCTGWR